MSKEYFFKIEIMPEHAALSIHAHMYTIITGAIEVADAHTGVDLYAELLEYILSNTPEGDVRMIYNPDFWQVTALNII